MDYDNKGTATSSKESAVSQEMEKSAENAKLKFPPKKSQSGNGVNLVMILNYDINKFLSKINPEDLDDKDNSVGIGELHVTILPNISDDVKTNKQASSFIENQVKSSGVLTTPLTLGKVGTFDMSARNVIFLEVLRGSESLEGLHDTLKKTLPNDPYFKEFKLHVTIARLKEKVDFHKYLKEFKDIMVTVEPKEVILSDKDHNKLLTILP